MVLFCSPSQKRISLLYKTAAPLCFILHFVADSDKVIVYKPSEFKPRSLNFHKLDEFFVVVPSVLVIKLLSSGLLVFTLTVPFGPYTSVIVPLITRTTWQSTVSVAGISRV